MLQMKVFQRRWMVEDTEPLVVCLLTSFLKIVIFPVFISFVFVFTMSDWNVSLCFISFYKLCAKWNFFLCNSSRKKNFEGFFFFIHLQTLKMFSFHFLFFLLPFYQTIWEQYDSSKSNLVKGEGRNFEVFRYSVIQHVDQSSCDL